MCETAALHRRQKQGSPVVQFGSLASEPSWRTRALLLLRFTLTVFSGSVLVVGVVLGMGVAAVAPAGEASVGVVSFDL